MLMIKIKSVLFAYVWWWVRWLQNDRLRTRTSRKRQGVETGSHPSFLHKTWKWPMQRYLRKNQISWNSSWCVSTRGIFSAASSDDSVNISKPVFSRLPNGRLYLKVENWNKIIYRLLSSLSCMRTDWVRCTRPLRKWKKGLLHLILTKLRPVWPDFCQKGHGKGLKKIFRNWWMLPGANKPRSSWSDRSHCQHLIKATLQKLLQTFQSIAPRHRLRSVKISFSIRKTIVLDWKSWKIQISVFPFILHSHHSEQSKKTTFSCFNARSSWISNNARRKMSDESFREFSSPLSWN